MEAILSKRRQSQGEVDLSKTVLKAPMDRDKLVSCLRSALDIMFPASERYASRSNGKSSTPSRIRYNDLSDSLKMFDQFLSGKENDTATISIDENLMTDFLAFLDVQKAHWGTKPREIICCRVRTLINALPSKLRNRIILSPADYKRATRFHCFSQLTQDAIRQFLVDGRSTKRNGHNNSERPSLTGRLLSPSYRKSVVEHLQLFLKTIGKMNVADVVASDADMYLDAYTARDLRQVAINNLADLNSFFANIWARGIIDKLPFNTVFAKKTNVDDDFIPPQGLAVLQDLSKVDLKDFVEVRNRLLAFCLCYDFALRIGEVALLNVEDISIDEFVELHLRSNIQKGNDKPEKTSYSFFPESKILMTAYLKLREQKHPDTNALIVSEKGERMLVNGCRDAIQDLCAQLGVKTFKNNLPAPHRFRHSLGSCNVEPLGLNLDIYEIMRRLRHTSVELTTKTYITNNPLLEKAKHVAHVKAHRASTIQQNRINNRHVEPQSNEMNLPRPSPALGLAQVSMPFTPSSQDFSVPENDALKMLASFEITRQGLRKYAEGQGMGEGTDEAFYYSRQFIEDLSYNYMTKQETMATVGLRKSGLQYWMSSKGIQAVVIGKTSLIRKDDVLARNKEENLKKAG